MWMMVFPVEALLILRDRLESEIRMVVTMVQFLRYLRLEVTKSKTLS